MKKFTLFTLAFSLSIPILVGSGGDAYAAAVRDGFDSNTLVDEELGSEGSDDGSTGAVNLGFSDNIKFFSFETDNLFVNNNGNISFDSPLAAFTPFDLSTTNKQIIAPFFADVDTRFTGMPVTYGTGTVSGRDAFGVNWVSVDCFGVATPDDELPLATIFNSFQLVLIERFDTGAMNFDIELNYDSIKWETAESTGGDETCLDGPPGSSARIGYSDGGVNTFEFSGSGVSNSFLDSSLPSSSLIQNSLNSDVLGRYIIPVRGGIPNPEPQPEPMIGGKLLDINTASLLVGGIGINALYAGLFIPIAIGIGLVLVKRK